MMHGAEIIQRVSYLDSDFGLELAIDRFKLNKHALAEITGSYKYGKLKGRIEWKHVRKPGVVSLHGTNFTCPIICSYGFAITKVRPEPRTNKHTVLLCDKYFSFDKETGLYKYLTDNYWNKEQ